jgi:hypothetical protein
MVATGSKAHHDVTVPTARPGPLRPAAAGQAASRAGGERETGR